MTTAECSLFNINQRCRSGTGSAWIRIDFGRLDPDPHWVNGSGFRRAKRPTKIEKTSEIHVKVLDVLF
jgi:hypothetical protein